MFVGLKMIADYWAPSVLGTSPEEHLVHPAVSLVIVVSLLGISIVASLIASRRERAQAAQKEPDQCEVT